MISRRTLSPQTPSHLLPWLVAAAGLGLGEPTASGAAPGDPAEPMLDTEWRPPPEPVPEVLEPEPGIVEAGLFLGLFLPSSNHELYDYPTATWRELSAVAPELGLRGGYFPLVFLGGELEGALMLGSTADDQGALLLGLRGHLVGQLPGRITPFLVAGYGTTFLSSDPAALGDDSDGGFHWGLGAKLYATPQLVARIDVRHLITAGHDEPATENSELASHFELLLGASWVFNRPDHPPPPDRDGDGWIDAKDKCPDVAGVIPEGCPDPDTDGDTVVDRLDRCVDVKGERPDGCPPPDGDKDGVFDRDDECPTVAGEKPKGCPPPDEDGDGVLDRDDKCPREDGDGRPDGCPDTDGDGIADHLDKCPVRAEKQNGFEDDDGCPDELPTRIARFTGVIRGINFDTGSAQITKGSFPLLNQAVKVLQDYPALRMEISGFTDDVGDEAANQKLSEDRAESVKRYLVEQGVDASRLSARGLGEESPIETNRTAKGRAQNRRIEFKLVQ